MFDLKREVAKWRTGLERALLGSKIIDELESHVREEFDRQVFAGRSEAESFAFAIQQLGETTTMCREFAKDGKALRGASAVIDRLGVGFIHTRDIKVLSFTAAILGGLGFVAFGLYAWMLPELKFWHNPIHFLRSFVTAVVLCAMSALALVKSWQCFRSHEIAAARVLVGFSLLMGWLLVPVLLDYTGYLILNYHMLFHAGPVGKFIYYSATLFVACLLWCAWMRRLARLASHDPIRCVDQMCTASPNR